MKDKSLIIRFTLLEVFYWCSVAAFSSFAIAYLQAVRGVSDSSTGIMIMLMTTGAFLGQFVSGYLCDRFRTHKIVLIIYCALQAPICILLFNARSVPVMYMLYAFLGFIQSAMPANIDTWILRSFPENPGIYGPIRSIGSLGYAIFTLGYCAIINRFGYSVMTYFTAFFIIAGAAVSLSTPDVHIVITHGAKKTPVTALLKNKQFVLILATLLASGICSYAYSFLANMLRSVGGSVSMLGLIMCASGLTQVPFMMFGRKLIRIPARIRVAAGCVMYALMALLFAIATSPALLIVGSLMSGIAYGLILPAIRQWVYDISPVDARATAQGVTDAVYTSLGGVLTSGAVGALADSIGMKPLLIGMAVIQLAGMMPMLLSPKAAQQAE